MSWGQRFIEQTNVDYINGRHSRESGNPDASESLDSGSSPE